MILVTLLATRLVIAMTLLMIKVTLIIILV